MRRRLCDLVRVDRFVESIALVLKGNGSRPTSNESRHTTRPVDPSHAQRSPAGLRQSLVRPVAERLRRRLILFTAGGRWTYRLRPSVRRNLRWLWFDGLFASSADSIVGSYLPLFILALGGGRAQIGLMSSLSSLTAALLLLPGSAVIERWERRKAVVVFNSSVSRAALLLLALVPLLFSGSTVLFIVIVLAVVLSTFANLSIPAWTPLIADLVPWRWRGRYFSSRNMAMVVSGMVMTLLAGQLITVVGSPGGYQLAMGLAFVAGVASVSSFARIEEPGSPSTSQAVSKDARAPLLEHLRSHPEFLTFCAASALWHFSINIAGPFFNPYLVERLGATAGVIGALGVVASLASLAGHRLFGPLTDRWGPRRVQVLTGLLLPLTPLGWLLARSPWHAVPMNVAGGFLWAGYGTASFNFQLMLTPPDRRPRYAAILQVVVLAALAGGAGIGGIIAETLGYKATFIASAVGRLVAALVFVRFVRLSD